MSYKLCPECDQPILRKGQTRKNEDEYRHASGCPLDDYAAATIDALKCEIATLTATNKRLSEALERIKDESFCDCTAADKHMPYLRHIHDIATAALSEVTR